MNTFQNSTNNPANNSRTDFSKSEQALLQDVREFFQTDSCAQIVGSMNALVEAFLFAKGLENLTPEMRVDIANQLRAATLLSKLNENNHR